MAKIKKNAPLPKRKPEAAEEKPAKPGKKFNDALKEISASQLSTITGKSYRTIAAKLLSVPIARKDSTGIYYEIRKALEAVYISKEESDYDKDENLLMKQKLKHETAKAEKAQIEVELLSGESLKTEVVEKVWTTMTSSFRAKILAVPTQVSLQLLGEKDVKKIEEKIKNAQYEALDELKEFNLEQYIKESNRESGEDLSTAAKTNGK